MMPAERGGALPGPFDPTPSVSPSRRSVAHARTRVPLLAEWPDGQPVTDCAAMA